MEPENLKRTGKCTKKSQRCKSLWADWLSVDLIKLLDDDNLNLVVRIFNEMHDSGNFPFRMSKLSSQHPAPNKYYMPSRRVLRTSSVAMGKYDTWYVVGKQFLPSSLCILNLVDSFDRPRFWIYIV